jgi:microsomal dipeptidase-like Zn-dependent dipeptidase
VIASHSGLKSIVDVPRNLTDEEAKAIAAKGGVVDIVAFAAYLKSSQEFKDAYAAKVWVPFGLKPGVDDPQARLSPADYQRFQEGYREFSRNEWRYATLADYVNAIDAAVKLVGIDHVGLASDFNHGGGVTGYASEGDGPNITRELLARGYSEADIDKLWGGNFLRVLRAVEQVAAKGGGHKS